MAEFNLVDESVKSIKTAEEYLKVGMDMCNEVALDFMENKEGDGAEYIEHFRKMMLKLVSIEQDVQNLKDTVEEVKHTDPGEGETMAGLLNQMLSQKTTDERALLQHESIMEFNDRMFKALHPGEAASSAMSADVDIEMTQETIQTRCPYTGKDMVNPVKNQQCGHNYERDAIIQYIKQRKKKAKCPIVGCSNDKPIDTSDLVDNKELKRYIDKKNRQTDKSRN